MSAKNNKSTTRQPTDATSATAKWPRMIISGLIILTIIMCVTALLVPDVEAAIVINPFYESGGMNVFMPALLVFAIAGLLYAFLYFIVFILQLVRISVSSKIRAFIKSMSEYVLIAFLVYLMILTIFCTACKSYEGIDYSKHKSTPQVKRHCVVTENGVASITLKFLDDAKEYQGTINDNKTVYAHEGDTAIAIVLNGSFGILYITDIFPEIK